MVPFDRFTVVLDACTLFPMLTRDILLTLASHEFFSPKWSPQIRDEWMRNLTTRFQEKHNTDCHAQVQRISNAMDSVFPDALVEVKHPDDFIMDLVELNEKRAAVAFRELRARKKNPPWERDELIRRSVCPWNYTILREREEGGTNSPSACLNDR